MKLRAGAHPETGWRGTCQRCGRYRPLQASHNIGRGHCLATRLDSDNGLALCAGCHRVIDSVAEEKRELFLRHLGPERYERLELMRKARGVRVDLSLVLLSLQQEIRRLVA